MFGEVQKKQMPFFARMSKKKKKKIHRMKANLYVS